MGAGIASAGFSIVAWGTMGKIAASWIISPVLGGVIAAIFLYAIKKSMVYKEDKITAAKKWVPIFVAIMSWAFVTYLTLKGLKKIWPSIVDVLVFLPDAKKPSFLIAAIFGLIVAGIVYLIVKKTVANRAHNIENSRDGINLLFTVPLIFAAALLSFAHGANDVANAIGPLAAINDAVMTGGISTKAGIPLWVMAVGALGIALGLALYGPKLIRTVGSEITELGLPVSSTHIAIGGIFGVGFLREYLETKKEKSIISHEQDTLHDEKKLLKAYKNELKTLEEKSEKSKEDYIRVVDLYKMIDEEESLIKEAKKQLKSAEKVKYVKRDALKKIIAAWVITVPAAAILSAAIFFMIRGIVL
jgi:PiT family inorganic phosphate transporter